MAHSGRGCSFPSPTTLTVACAGRPLPPTIPTRKDAHWAARTKTENRGPRVRIIRAGSTDFLPRFDIEKKRVLKFISAYVALLLRFGFAPLFVPCDAGSWP